MSTLALGATLVALVLVATWFSGGLILGAWRFAWCVKALRPMLERLAPLAMLLPITLSVGVTVAAAIPAAQGCHCGGGLSAALHLCFVHPEQSLSLLPLALLPLLVLAVRIAKHAPPFLRRARAGLALSRSGRLFNRVAAPIGNAFSILWPRPRIVVDSAWWSELRPLERRIVLAHECAHLRRGDPIVLELLSSMALFLPRSLAGSVLTAWRDHAERQADAVAARKLGDPSAVASLLVSLHRGAQARTALGLAFQDGSGLESRVRALLEGRPTISTGTDLGPRSRLAMALAIGLPLAMAQRVHAFIESLIGVLS